MIQVQTKLSKGNQLTLPSAIRKAMSMEAENPVTLIYDEGTLTIKKAETQEENLRRVLKELERLRIEHEKHMTLEQKAFAEMTRGWTANQLREYIDNTPEHKAYIKEKYGV